MRRFDPAMPEMMDRPGQDLDLLRQDLTVLETINRRLGGLAIPSNYLPQFDLRRADGSPPYRPVGRGALTAPPLTVLDLGTGAGDIPRALADRYEVTGVDKNPDVLRIARERSNGKIRFEQHDLLALPYAPGSFDVVLCSLTLHHFTENDAVAILRRIHEIARIGYIVNDLRRNPVATWLAKLMAHTIITNPIAKFDAPASCERAFNMSELRALAQQAGLEQFSVRRHPVFRMVLIGRK